MFKALFDILKTKDLLVPAVRIADDALGKSRRLTEEAMASLFDGKEPTVDVYALDKEINAAEVEVRRMVFEHLAGRSQGDIVTSVVLLTTIIDTERIGDYAKNLYQQGARLQGEWPKGEPYDEIAGMRDDLLQLFDHTTDALRHGKREQAQRVMEEHAAFGKHCERLVDYMCNGSGMSNRHAVVATLTVRYMKRVGAHLSNLASSVVNPVDRIGFRPVTSPADPPEDI